MSLPTPLDALLQGKSQAMGFWLTLPSTAVARTILRSTAARGTQGFSWVLIDSEHGLINDGHWYDLTTAIASEGASPIIRIPWGEEWMIKRALDAGAHGIVTPMCHTAEDAKKIVQYCKYPPQGTRGYGPMYTVHAFLGVASSEQYVAGSQTALKVVVQIETPRGLDNVEEIAAVDGVDVLFIGPFDLAMQTGMERTGKEHEAAIQRILKAAHSAKKLAAIFCTGGDDARVRREQGFDLISVTTDVGALGSAMSQELSIAQGDAASAKERGGY